MNGSSEQWQFHGSLGTTTLHFHPQIIELLRDNEEQIASAQASPRQRAGYLWHLPRWGCREGIFGKGKRRTGNPRYFSIILSAPLSAAAGGNRIPGISRGWAGMSSDFSPGVFRLFYLTSHIPGSVPPLILLLYDLQWLQASAADKRCCNT